VGFRLGCSVYDSRLVSVVLTVTILLLAVYPLPPRFFSCMVSCAGFLWGFELVLSAIFQWDVCWVRAISDARCVTCATLEQHHFWL